MKKIFMSLILLTGFAVQAEGLRDVSQYNLENGLGLKGYDPISFRQSEKGSAGSDQLAIEYENVIYKFVSAENQEVFLESAQSYEPTYGGWCAYAMALGSQVDINPAHFTVVGDRTHFFVNSRAKRNFDRDVEKFEAQADANWEALSGETAPAL